MHDDQLVLPWGTVTPEFWSDLAEDEPDEPPAYEEPAFLAEMRTAEPVPAAALPAPAREVPTAVLGPVAVGQAPAAAPAPVQSEQADYAGRFAALAEKLTKPQTNLTLLLASSEAMHLDQELTDVFGPSDPNVISVRELRALIAHLQGQRAAAARLYLHVTGLQATVAGVGHDLTKANAQRTFAEWKAITDPVERAAVGRDILPMLTAVAGAKAKATREVQAALGG
ncbi:hypothetical protein ACGF07_31970 [Kitasatospora sp. NPDC048194]|uniref:hypothetical protein n=1 Tax=Kitasatospora sp. NPDC048194 TaxID=3364045 RepID=UPI00371E7BD1